MESTQATELVVLNVYSDAVMNEDVIAEQEGFLRMLSGPTIVPFSVRSRV